MFGAVNGRTSQIMDWCYLLDAIIGNCFQCVGNLIVLLINKGQGSITGDKIAIISKILHYIMTNCNCIISALTIILGHNHSDINIEPKTAISKFLSTC